MAHGISIRFSMGVLALWLSLSRAVMAEGVSGSVELSASAVDSRTRDVSGSMIRTETDSFTERGALYLARTLYPYLKFNAGGTFEKNRSVTDLDGTETSSTVTTVRPYFDLTLRNPLYTAGAGYSMREEKDLFSGSPSQTLVSEEYSGIAAWRPDGFPSVELRSTRTNTFDRAREFQDTTRDLLQVSSKYSYRTLSLSYVGTEETVKNKLDGVETSEVIRIGRASYADALFDKRLSFTTSYGITHDEGTAALQLVPVSGLSGVTSPPDTPAFGALEDNPALVDGNFAAGSGIDIGLSASQSGDTRERNMGLDFFTTAEVNTLSLWVDRALPGTIPASFTWSVYTGSDNLNWTLQPAPSSVTFGPSENRFVITLGQSVTARYVKVVTRPLPATAVPPPGTDLSHIFVTELQASLAAPAGEVGRRFSQTVQDFSLNARTRLLDDASLFYELSYFVRKATLTTSFLSNGLFATRRFNSVFSGSARFAREDLSTQDGDKAAYVSTASLTATPLPALRHTLVYSGRAEEEGAKRNTVLLNNTAELYKGITAGLSGSLGFEVLTTGERNRSSNVNAGSSMIPHRTLTLNLGYRALRTEHGGAVRSATSSQGGTVGVTYRPFETLYLVAQEGRVREKGVWRNTQNYSVDWSPFPDGALQFTLTYNESIGSVAGQTNTFFSPAVRWNISTRSSLEAAYSLVKNESTLTTTETKIGSGNFRMLF